MEKIGLFILENVYQNFYISVLKVMNSIEELITKFVKSIQSLILIDICLTRENSTQVTDIIQNYHYI